MGLGAASRASYHDGPDILSSIFSILILFPFTSLQVRRYHDIGLSGKWFIPIMAVGCGVWIPFSIFNSAEVFDSSLDFFFLAVIISSFCFITNFIISCLRPTAGDNKYGSNPLTQNADQRGSVQSKKSDHIYHSAPQPTHSGIKNLGLHDKKKKKSKTIVDKIQSPEPNITAFPEEPKNNLINHEEIQKEPRAPNSSEIKTSVTLEDSKPDFDDIDETELDLNKADIAIKYRPEIQEFLNSLKAYETKIKQLLIIDLAKNPKISVDELRKNKLIHLEQDIDSLKTKSFQETYDDIFNHSPIMANRFKEVAITIGEQSGNADFIYATLCEDIETSRVVEKGQLILSKHSKSWPLLNNSLNEIRIDYQLLQNDYTIGKIRKEKSGSNDESEKIFFGSLQELKEYFELTDEQSKSIGRKKHFSDLYRQSDIIK